MWRAWWTLPVNVVRAASVVHAIAGVWMIHAFTSHFTAVPADP